MAGTRIPAAVCAVVGDVLRGSHKTLDALFEAAGVPGTPPSLSHATKWKTWLLKAANDPNVDGLQLLGRVVEEFMDLPPDPSTPEFDKWQKDRQRLIDVLEEHSLRYYRGGRIIPNGDTSTPRSGTSTIHKPSSVQDVLLTVVRGLPRAMYPLTHRRQGLIALSFRSEHDIQDLLHSLLRPWIADIRPEEFTPSYAGSSTRMDFLLAAHRIVVEVKFIRDKIHGRKVGNELILDIEHYRRHPECDTLWCVIYDPNHFIPNQPGLARDLEGKRSMPDGTVDVRVVLLSL